MPKLITTKQSLFTEELRSHFEQDEELTALDIFDAFAKAFGKGTDLLSESDIKVLIFKQFKEYCNFDETVTEVVKNVSDIQKSTEAAITAIDNNDTKSLKSAYTQLKSYQKRILELEQTVYTDETTGVSNRKHLTNHELDEEGQFRFSGTLMHIKINNFADINRSNGHQAGDAVLKFVSNVLDKHLKTLGVRLIRYVGVEFVAIPKDAVSVKAEKMFRDTLNLIQSKKFKTQDGEILNIELEFLQAKFTKEQSFSEVYEGL